MKGGQLEAGDRTCTIHGGKYETVADGCAQCAPPRWNVCQAHGLRYPMAGNCLACTAYNTAVQAERDAEEPPTLPLRGDVWEVYTTTQWVKLEHDPARPWWLVQVLPTQISPDKHKVQAAYVWARRRPKGPSNIDVATPKGGGS